MRFKFCGDLDAPDWLLAEIFSLSKISSVRVKLLSAQVINNILGNGIDYGKVNKLIADAKLDVNEKKASMEALYFIISNAAKYDVEDNQLMNELQQLGLPKEHCESLGRPYREAKPKLQKILAEDSLKLTSISNIRWRVDFIVGSSEADDMAKPVVHLCFDKLDRATGESEEISLSLPEGKFRALLTEIDRASSLTKSLNVEA